jgi:hypothetical protein
VGERDDDRGCCCPPLLMVGRDVNGKREGKLGESIVWVNPILDGERAGLLLLTTGGSLLVLLVHDSS